MSLVCNIFDGATQLQSVSAENWSTRIDGTPQLQHRKWTDSWGPLTTMERMLTERVRGPLNLEPWAGSEYGNNMDLIQLILDGGGG